MVDRLSSAESDFLYLDATAPSHVGQVLTFARPDEFVAAKVVGAIAARVAAYPRYRQVVRGIPGGLGRPLWVDDQDFDLDYHVRRSALPAPGSADQLAEYVARVCSRPLDRRRPLWECYVVEGLADDRFAVVTKVHQALVDSVASADISGLSADPAARAPKDEAWQPAPGPGRGELVGLAVSDLVRRPSSLAGTVRTGVRDLRATASTAVRSGATLLRAPRSHGDSAFAISSVSARRYLMADADLAAYRDIRGAMRALGREAPTIHALALTVLTGALRAWLQARGDHVRADRAIRALVPVAVQDARGTIGSRVEPLFVDLPVGEASPLVRLHQVEFGLADQLRARAAVRADDLAAMSGFAAPALHLMGIRVGTTLSQRIFDLVVTNVPGPSGRMYADGVPLVATYPVLPLASGHALAVGMTSYRGKIHHGIIADRNAVPDLAMLGPALGDALAELHDWILREDKA